jgi:hypothetical protein
MSKALAYGDLVQVTDDTVELWRKDLEQLKSQAGQLRELLATKKDEVGERIEGLTLGFVGDRYVANLWEPGDLDLLIVGIEKKIAYFDVAEEFSVVVGTKSAAA